MHMLDSEVGDKQSQQSSVLFWKGMLYSRQAEQEQHAMMQHWTVVYAEA